ncbi:MAG: hypothetical protein MJK06_04480 [Hyphomicrobiales bacterium]|nr:hypothetical protein [Hyphomicrobiales bacterium]
MKNLNDKSDLIEDDTGKHIDQQFEKQRALSYLLEAWENAINDGVESDMIATAAIFAAISDMVNMYGEDPVAKMTESLAKRIRTGEFTLNKTIQ